MPSPCRTTGDWCPSVCPGIGTTGTPGQISASPVPSFVHHSGKVDQRVDGVVARAGSGQFDALDHDGPAAQEGVPAAMVEVQRAVDDHRDAVKADPGLRQSLPQRPPPGPVARLGPRTRVTDPGVEEKQHLVVPDR